jgi:hypothetical protein
VLPTQGIDNSQLSGTLDPAFSRWSQLVQIDLEKCVRCATRARSEAALCGIHWCRSTQLSGTLDPALAGWTNVQYLCKFMHACVAHDTTPLY